MRLEASIPSELEYDPKLGPSIFIMSSSNASPTITKRGFNKRTSNSYNVEEWKRHRPLITQLYFEEGRTLKEVREHLEREFNFAPTERMYKSRLHSWGLDKKKKEHEMLDLVRQGLLQKGDDRDKVFIVRGRQVTLADALHYFNRKGIKDPSMLLEPNALGEFSNDLSSPEDCEVKTPLSSRADYLDPGNGIDSDYELSQSPSNTSLRHIPSTPLNPKASEFPEQQLLRLQNLLQIRNWEPPPPYRTLSVESYMTSRAGTPLEVRYFDATFAQAKIYYTQLLTARELSVVNTSWSATSDDELADLFYYSMYQGYGNLWNGQRDRAYEDFNKAFGMVPQLLQNSHVGFFIYVLDLIIRHDGTGHDQPLLLLLQQIADVAASLFGTNHPLYMIASWLRNPEGEISKAWIAESTMRKLLSFFQDSIGYFHPITIALLQTFATGLLNAQHHKEAALRFHQLVDAFETTQSPNSYEVCYALRTMSEAYFHAEMYHESAQVLRSALDRSIGLPRPEEREIHVRCFRAMAEIFNKLGRHDDAVTTMQYVVDCCIETFGPEHQFVSRAIAHQKSLRDGDATRDSAIPPVVYRLGRGGPAARWIWTTRSSPLRLQV